MAETEECTHFDAFITRLKQGNEQAWEKAQKLILSCASRFQPIGMLTPQDLAQEVFISKWRAIGRYQPAQGEGTVAQNFFGWIQRNVRNTFLTHREREKRHISISALAQATKFQQWEERITSDAAAIMEQFLRPADDPERHVARRQLLALIDGLSTNRKKVAARYSYVLGCTTQETAQLMGEKVTAMNTLLMRDIKQELRQLAQERGIDPDALHL